MFMMKSICPFGHLTECCAAAPVCVSNRFGCAGWDGERIFQINLNLIIDIDQCPKHKLQHFHGGERNSREICCGHPWPIHQHAFNATPLFVSNAGVLTLAFM